jgi:photosystem II stability/assembly factor-like uncharacterized protein
MSFRQLHRSVVGLFLASVFFCATFWTGTSRAQGWQPIGPDYGTVLTLAHQPSNDAVALAGTYFGGLYRSVDWGYTWKAVDVAFASSSVFAVTFDPRAQGRAYAAVFNGGVWRSDDAGLTWQNASTGLTDLVVQAVRPDPLVSQRLIAATASGVFISTDGATHWAPVPALAGVSGRSVAFDPLHAGTVYVGTLGSGIFRSTDGGTHWAALNPPQIPAAVTSLSFDAQGNLFAATDVGVLELKAGASVWTDLSFNLPRLPVADVFPHPTVADLLFASTGSGVYAISNRDGASSWFHWTGDGARFTTTDSRGLLFHVANEIGLMRVSNDFGATWGRGDYGIQTAFVGGMASTQGSTGRRLLAGTDLGVMALDDGAPWKHTLKLREGVFEIHARGSSAYAGMETSGVWKSADSGATWAASSNGIVPMRVSNLSFTAETTAQLLVATSSGAYRSADAGQNWSSIRLPEVSFVHAIAADPMRPPIIYLGSGGGRVYRSLDAGKNFAFAGSGLPSEDILQLVHAPWTGVYAITATGKLYSTVDNGVSWYRAQTGCDSPALAVAVEPQRSWMVYLATAGGGICKSSSGGQQWSAANEGVDNPYVTSLWINPGNPQQVWAGSVGRVYRSNDGGGNWATLAQGLPSGIVTTLAGNPMDASHLLAVVYGAGLYETRNQGASWALRSAAEVALTALSVRFDPAVANRVILGSLNRGVQVSTDSGLTWQSANNGMSLFVRSITSDPGSANTLYAGTLGGGVFRSTDGAANWSNIGLASGNVFRVRSVKPNNVLVGTANGIAVSDDGGGSWAQLGQYASYVFSVVADPLDSRRVVVGSIGGQVWTADTSGTRWRSVTGLPNVQVRALTVCNNGALFAAPEQAGVWKSSMATLAPWQNAGSTGLGAARITSLACDPRSGFLYAAANGQGVFLSIDGGAGWTAINQGLPGNIASSVVASPLNAWRVWVALQDGGVHRSDNAGLNWQNASIGLPTGGGVSHLVAGSDGATYAGTAQGVFHLPVGGTVWIARSSGLPSGKLTALWADPKRSGVVMAAVAGLGVFLSGNAGITWTRAVTDPNSADVVAFSGDAQRIHAATLGTGLGWSTNGGVEFGSVQRAEAIPQVVTDLAVDAADGNALYLATGGQGMLTSRDGGGHWRAVNNGLSNLSLLCLVVHPTRSRELYAGTHAGVFMTRDAGATWTEMNQGLINRNVTALTFDTQIPDVLYVGIEGGGIYYHVTRP